MNWNLLLNCSLRADKAVDAFQLIVVESQRSQVSQVLERVLIDVVGLVVSNVGEQGEWGPLEGPLVRRMPSACCLLFL